MIESKKFGIITGVAVTLALVIVVLLIGLSGSPAAETLAASGEPAYATALFGREVMTIDIVANESDWQTMLDNAINEQYICADVVVNGTRYTNVGIRPKGNNSLQQVVSSDSDRYSFKVKFDEYVDGQTCYGLDMLVLNDMLGDATYMKEYTAFDMMRELGVTTPYYGYAMITLNGEDWGLYFALEAYSDSFKARISGDESGCLYNVKAANGDDAVGIGGRGGGGMGGSNSGGSLVYTGDDSSDYSAIFGNAVGTGTDEEDYQRVIAALKALDEGTDIEKYFDVDEILRYLAVHTLVVNLDSYSSNMAQNYYIYEYDGVLQILPWDYNYAWGAFQSQTASSVVNFPMDTPVIGVEMSDRPLIARLFENEEYLERYHSYMRELLDNYFTDGKFQQKINELDSVIGEYVQKDPTAFYTYEEYQTALTAFANIGNLRAESLYGQLDGTVPSTTAGQRENSSALIDSSSVNLSDLGGSGMGGNFGGGGMGNFSDNGGNFGKFGGFSDGDTDEFFANKGNRFGRDFSGGSDSTDSTDNSGMPGMPAGGNMPDMPTDGSVPGMPADGSIPDMPADGSVPGMPEGTPDMGENAPENAENSENSNAKSFKGDSRNMGENTPAAPAGPDSGYLITAGACLLLLILAIAGTALVKRKF